MTDRHRRFPPGVVLSWFFAFVLVASGHPALAGLVIVCPFMLLLVEARETIQSPSGIPNGNAGGSWGLQCPRCGGVQFQAIGSKAAKADLGALGPKDRVRCIGCGAQFTRE